TWLATSTSLSLLISAGSICTMGCMATRKTAGAGSASSTVSVVLSVGTALSAVASGVASAVLPLSPPSPQPAMTRTSRNRTTARRLLYRRKFVPASCISSSFTYGPALTGDLRTHRSGRQVDTSLDDDAGCIIRKSRENATRSPVLLIHSLHRIIHKP